MDAILRLLRYMKPYFKLALFAPIFMVLEVTMDLSQPRLLQNMIDTGILHKDIPFVIHTGIIMVCCALAGFVGGCGCTVFSTLAAQNTGKDIRDVLFKNIQTFSFKNIDSLNTGHLITVLTNDVTQIQNIFMMALRILIRAPLLVIGSLIMALVTSLKLSLIFIVLIPFLLIVLLYFINKAYPLFSVVQKKLDVLNTIMQENLSGIRLVKAFTRSEYETGKFEKANDDFTGIMVKASKTVAVIGPFMMITMNLGVVAVIWFGGLGVIAGSIEVGKILAFINYLLQLLSSLMMVAMIFMNFSRAQASADRIVKVLDTKPVITDTDNALVKDIKGQVSFENVTFSYNDDIKNAVLKDISFTAKPGETVAILGETGSGKSSLVHLIPRYYDVTLGSVKIDGIDVRDFSTEALRKNIAMVMQDTVLFSGSIKDNIRYGKPSSSENEVMEASKAAQAHSFIESFKDGYETELGQRGVNISGGQKQRISIARALIMKPKILILDDSTSAVDFKTESEIREELNGLMKGTTTFIIAQRITSVLNADKIIVLNEGKIDSIGTHSELMAKSDIYRDIYRSQIGEEAVQDA